MTDYYLATNDIQHEKEQNLQQLANGVTALGQGCLSHIDIVGGPVAHSLRRSNF